MARKKAKNIFGYEHKKKVRKKRKGRHSKRANPKHKKVKRRYRGQGR